MLRRGPEWLLRFVASILCAGGIALGRPRQGLTPLTSAPPKLEETLKSFRELQAELSRSVLALDAGPESEEALTYEINPMPPQTSTTGRPKSSSPRSRVGQPHHRLRHSEANRRRHPTEWNLRVNAFARAANEAAASPSLPSLFHGLLPPKKACPSMGGKERLACPSRSRRGYHVCISLEELCDHRAQCPNGEDESPLACLFYRTTMAQFKRVVDAVVSLTDHMVKAEESHREL